MLAVHATPGPSSSRSLVVVLLVALAVRVVWGVAFFDELQADPDGYRAIAECLGRFHVFGQIGEDSHGEPIPHPTAFRPPLYPLVLAGIAGGRSPSPINIWILHTLLGVLTVAATWRLAHAWQLPPTCQWTGPFLVAADPLLLHQSTVVMTETLVTCLLLGGLLTLTWFDQRPSGARAFWVGVALGIGSLCRPTVLPFIALVGLTLLLQKLSWKQRCWHLLALVAGCALLLAPWTLRNFRTFQKPITTTTHGGYTLLLANNPSFYAYLRENDWGEPWDPASFHAAWAQRVHVAEPSLDYWDRAERLNTGMEVATQTISRTEVEEDRFAQELARQVIGNTPGQFLWSCGVRVGWLWRPIPQKLAAHETAGRRWQRYAVGLWYSALYLLVMMGGKQLVNRSIPSWKWGLLLGIATTVTHAVYWSNIRMRAPLIPVLALYAACGGVAVSGWIVRRKA